MKEISLKKVLKLFRNKARVRNLLTVPVDVRCILMLLSRLVFFRS